ncbi:MAG: hypothetical protein AAF288_00465 [Planctomycetota bacterium]
MNADPNLTPGQRLDAALTQYDAGGEALEAKLAQEQAALDALCQQVEATAAEVERYRQGRGEALRQALAEDPVLSDALGLATAPAENMPAPTLASSEASSEVTHQAVAGHPEPVDSAEPVESLPSVGLAAAADASAEAVGGATETQAPATTPPTEAQRDGDGLLEMVDQAAQAAQALNQVLDAPEGAVDPPASVESSPAVEAPAGNGGVVEDTPELVDLTAELEVEAPEVPQEPGAEPAGGVAPSQAIDANPFQAG